MKIFFCSSVAKKTDMRMKIFFFSVTFYHFPQMYCWKNESWLTDAQPYWLGTPTTNGGELASVVMLTPLLCIMYQHFIHHHASGLKIFNSVLFAILVRHFHHLNHVYNVHHGNQLCYFLTERFRGSKICAVNHLGDIHIHP